MYRYLSGRLKQLGITQSDLAKKFGLTQASISHRFSGRVSWSLDEMYRIMDIPQDSQKIPGMLRFCYV